MARVLITRPSPEGEQLCQLLQAEGISALHQPLITILPGEQQQALATYLCRADIVIAVSKSAVCWADRQLMAHKQGWPASPCYLAVGQKTADKLSQVSGQTVHWPGISDSEHLLQLPELRSVQGQQVVILRGNGGRELIRHALQRRGALVQYCEVYRRQELELDGPALVNEWQKQHVDHIVVTSAEQLSLLTGSLPEEHLGWLQQQCLLVPSQRVADIALRMGFHVVKVTGSASNPDLLATIKSLLTTG